MKLSLRSLIAIPLIAQVVVITAITGWLTHRNDQAAIEELAYQLLTETGEHFEHKLETYTAIPPLITQANLDSLELQQLDLRDLKSWLPHLFRQIQRFPDVTYIYYGHTDGRYVELRRLPHGNLKFALKDGTKSEEVRIFSVDSDGSLQSAVTPKTPYNPRQRPWYKVAQKNNQAQWTHVYDFEDPSPTLGLSFVRSYIDADNQFQGVLGADFTLEAIEQFIEHVQTSHTSTIFLMDTDGKILASSAGQSSFRKQTSSPSAQQQQQQSLVQTIVDHILQTDGHNKPLQNADHFRLRIQNVTYWVQITPFGDDYGLRWLGVSLLPEASFTEQLRTNSQNTLLLCLLAMGISSGLSLMIARWINRPIQQLGVATQALVKGDTSQCILPSFVQELDLLIKSFNQMGGDLSESRSQLKLYSQHLEDLVEQRTQALRQSEETFAKAFQASPNAITLSTLDEGRYIKVNDRFVELLGIPRENIIGYTSTELNIWIEPNTRAVFKREVEQGQLRNQEWTVQNSAGEVKTVLLSADIIHFQKQACVLMIANDIGDRIAEQEKLRQSEERWQLALQGNNDGIWDWNIAADQIFYSVRWKNMLGYDDSEIKHHKSEWESRLHPEDRDRVLQATQAHLDQHTPFFIEEYRLRCKDGQYKWVLDRGQALWDADGNPIRMVGSHTDISDRKRNEAIIQRQEQFLRSIYNGVEAGIFVIDVLGYRRFRYIDSNAAIKRMTDICPTDLVNATPEELFSPDTAVDLIDKYQRCIDQGKPSTFEEEHLINKQSNWWLTTLTPLNDHQGRPYRIISTTLNITKRKTTEEELAHQNIALETAIQAAEQASRVKGEFLTNMSHELRTPLNAILGFAQLMQRSLKYNPDRFQQDSAKHLQVIQTSGDHLLTLINDVLDMAKIEAGQMSLNLQPFNLHQLLQSVEAMFQPKAQEKGLLLKYDYAPEVPQYVITDAAKLRQILINLLGNAVKFTHHGQIHLRVKGQQQLHIEVEDTGQGIAPHHLARLFDAFYQTESGQEQAGTGLGLAISKTYVELLGGILSVHSSPNQGSHFRFTLPVTPIETLDNQNNDTYPTVIRLAPQQPSYRILVVEDKWASRTLLVNLLETAGFDVRAAANGEAAIDIWQTWHPHLIWMDMRMPVMDGYAATRHIRNSTHGQETAIIALTASALESEKKMILSVGCNDFICKPFQESTIFKKLQQHLGVHYIYDNQQPNSSVLAVDHQHQLTVEQLTQQQPDWLHRLQSASSLADAESVSQLIDELPPTHTQLATSLTQLVQGFRCDLIAEFSASSIQQQKS
ncbi:MAG: PAS domain S-box protein [Cyanobacteria bacterium P01_B01_bin.77]